MACCCGKCTGACSQNNPCQDGCQCVNGQCQDCQCEDGTRSNPGGFGTVAATVCTSSEFVCIEYTYSGADCNQNNVGQSFYSATGSIEYRPCSANTAIGARAFPCGGSFPDAFDIKGTPSCTTVTYGANCNCTASNCNWGNVVASWANIYGGIGQCDCVIELRSYSIKQSGQSCP